MKTKLLAILLVAGFLTSCSDSTEISPSSSKNKGRTQARGVVRTFSWKGFTWQVRGTAVKEGPGPNYFSGNNVWLDASGRLHLRLAKNPTTGGWECAELNTVQKLGYGTYQWKIEGNLDVLDKNIVFGLFNYSGNDRFDEMDIEFSKWGVATNKNMLNYTVWPETGSAQSNVDVVYPFTLTGGNWTTHRFRRTSNSITFKSCYGFYDTDTNLFANRTFNNPPVSISRLAMPIYMNLWCFKGVPPTNGQNVEIIVHDFKFIPL